jgi:hypothetical protein
MEVICSSCGTKYAVADQRVRNRRVKTECRKCKAPIVIDGTTLPEPPEPAEPGAVASATPATATSSAPGSAKPVAAPRPRFAPPRPSPPRVQSNAGSAEPASSTAPTDAAAQPDADTQPAAPQPEPSAVAKPVPESRTSSPPGEAAVPPHSSQERTRWVVDLGSGEPEPMSIGEIAELYVRGAITNWTRVRAADAKGELEELASVAELRDALAERGVMKLQASEELPVSRPVNEPPLAPGAKAIPVDLAAPTQTVQASELWSAAGVVPMQRSRKKPRSEASDGARGSSSPAASEPPRLAAMPGADAEEEAATTLYQRGQPLPGLPSKATTTDPGVAKSAGARAAPRDRARFVWLAVGLVIALIVVALLSRLS